MDQPKGRGRARGRGRGEKGRARGKDQDVPRPGQGQQEQQPPPQQPRPALQPAPPPAVSAWGPRPPSQPVVPQGAQAPGAGEGAAMIGGGRAVRRGTSRAVEARPGGDQGVEEIRQEMQQMSVGEEGAVGGVGVEPVEPPPPQEQQQGQQQQRPRFTREDLWQLRFGTEDFRNKDLKDKTYKTNEDFAVRANYFRMTVPENWKLYQYHVDFLPFVDSSKMRTALLFSHSEVIGPVKAFDGMVLFVPQRLEHDETVVYSNRRSDNANIKLTIRFRCEVQGVTPASLQVLNIIWRKILGMMHLKPLSRHFFDFENKIPIPKHGLEVIPGYQTSILYYEQDTLLDIDLTYKLLGTTTVLDLMYMIHRNSRHEDEFRNKVTKEIVGLVVLTRYNNKTYTVSDIDWDARVTGTFERNHVPVSFLQYYHSQYNIQIRDHGQPMLMSKSKKRDIRAGRGEFIYLVPELCFITGLTEASRTDFNLKRDLATHTRVGPDVRASRLMKFVGDVTRNPPVAEELKSWNLALDNQMVSIRSHQLKCEQLFMYDNRQRDAVLSYDQMEADWSRDMRGKKFRLPVSLDRHRWLMVFTRHNRGNAEALIQTLKSVGPPMGMQFGEPDMLQLDNDRNDTFVNGLRHAIKVPDTKMVVCVLPNNRKDRYDAIKKHCCLDNPVPSQMVLDRTLSNQKRLMSVATKIAIQMNCKLGGIIWSIHIPLPKTMIVGLDTYHDSSKRGSSVCAIVASVSPDHARYYSTCTFQLQHQELANHLRGAFILCMNAFKRENGDFPEKIVVFRDGVGDGQLQMVNDHEIPQIRDAIGPRKLTFIVVKKRINARFFVEGRGQQGAGRGDRGGQRQPQRGGGGYSNPNPGTVIDDVVTKHSWFDFFLISQSVREGTVTPTHYNVLQNDLNLKPEHVQKLAYKLCHMYFNWQGTIRVPAPCMYAHKMAFLVGQSLHKNPASALSLHLFYL